MIPVFQTIEGPELGNCYAACIASIFEIPIDKIPNPNPNLDFYRDIYGPFLEKYNLCLAHFKNPEGSEFFPAGYQIAGVKSPRFDCDHAVVVYNGKIVHDPHPSKDSLTAKIIDWDIFYLIDPSKPMNIHELRG